MIHWDCFFCNLIIHKWACAKQEYFSNELKPKQNTSRKVNKKKILIKSARILDTIHLFIRLLFHWNLCNHNSYGVQIYLHVKLGNIPLRKLRKIWQKVRNFAVHIKVVFFFSLSNDAPQYFLSSKCVNLPVHWSAP